MRGVPAWTMMCVASPQRLPAAPRIEIANAPAKEKWPEDGAEEETSPEDADAGPEEETSPEGQETCRAGGQRPGAGGPHEDTGTRRSHGTQGGRA